jgi:peptide/nickel transport system substrate-binding protein
MVDLRLKDLLLLHHHGLLSRRDFLARAAALGAAATVSATSLRSAVLAAPGAGKSTIARSHQSDAKTLVVLDSLVANKWLYLDPGKIYEVNDQAAQNLLYDPLYQIPDGSNLTAIEPLGAADVPTMSADGLTATIKLRDGMKFHNSGNIATSADWVFSIQRLANLKGNPSFLFTDFFESITAIDPLTIELKLKAPNAALLAILVSAPFAAIDSVVAKEHGGTDASDADQTDTLTDWINEGNSLGTGPYKLTGWDPNTEVTLEANTDYWGDAPQFDRVIFRNVDDLNTQLQLLETGEADLAYSIDPDNFSKVTDNPDLQIIEGPSLAYEYLALNTTSEVGGPLANKSLRQAIASAIDYDGIISGLLGGAGVRPATIVPLGLQGADVVEPKKWVQDLAKAQSLFDASGLGSAEISLTYDAGGSSPGGVSREILASKLQSDLQQIKGLTVKLVPMDPTQRFADYRAGKLQFVMSDWAPDYADVHTYAEPFGHTGGGAAKRVGYSNPDVDALLDQGIVETDPAKRTDLYTQVQEIMIDDVPFIVEFQPSYRMPAVKSVTGVTPHGIFIIQLRFGSKTS